MTEQPSLKRRRDDEYSTNPVDPNPPLPNFITGLNIQQQTLIKDILNSDTLTLSEKIARIDTLDDEMSEETRGKYRRWRFEHDKSSVNAFLEKQKPSLQNIIRPYLSTQSNLDEFYNSMLTLLPSFDDKEAFLNWANSEILQSSSALMNDTNLMQNFQRNMSANTVDGARNKILFYMLYDEDPNEEGRICLFNLITFEVVLVKTFSTWAYPCEVTIGEDKIFLIIELDKVLKIFNYETGQLTKGSDPPEWRVGGTVAYYKEKLYYIGGEDSNEQDLTSVNILVNGIWQQGPALPINIFGASHAICNDKLYIISENAVFQLLDNEREWAEVGEMEERRFYPAVTPLNGKIYITGGGASDKTFNSCLCFDPSQPFERRFTSIANMNYKRQHHSLVVANGKLYAIGGYQKDIDQEFCKSVEEYDLATNQWRIVGEIE